MARNISAHLCDIIDVCDSIASILDGISAEACAETRGKRSAVKPEFIVIGEAASVLAKFRPDKFSLSEDGRKSIGFRSMLTRNYASAGHETAYEIALLKVPSLSCCPPCKIIPFHKSAS